MERFWKKKATQTGGEEKTKGEKKVPAKKQDQPRQDQKGNKPSQKDGKPKGPQAKQPKTVRNAQSALRPGNTSGLNKQKEHPMVQFGPILKEFLLSKEMVNKGIAVHYDQNSDVFDITVSFKKVLENGVSTSNQIDLKIEEYLAQRKGLLRVKDESSHYRDFVTKCLDRLGVDLTHAKPSVAFKSVESFVLKHLSPVEKGILHLADEDFDRVDTRKIPEIMKPSLNVIVDHYGGLNERSRFLVKTINTDGPITDLEPPNWALNGVSGLSKGVLLDTLRIQHVPKVTDEQRQIIQGITASLFGEDQGTQDASQSEDYKEKKEDTIL